VSLAEAIASTLENLSQFCYSDTPVAMDLERRKRLLSGLNHLIHFDCDEIVG